MLLRESIGNLERSKFYSGESNAWLTTLSKDNEVKMMILTNAMLSECQGLESL